jgi:hemoglobin
MMSTKTLYERLGGYDAISAVANDLLPRLRNDPQLGRFWAHRAEDSIQREKQLLIDFLGHAAATLAKFKVPEAEQSEVVKFVQGLKKEIVE